MRRVTPVLYEAGIIGGTSGASDFKELSKHDLKGAHLGETEEKQNAMYEKYKGGVLFFDEAYTYTVKDQYEKEPFPLSR